MVQGPCQENQIAVAESKFFDITNDLFNEITIKKAKDPNYKKSKEKKIEYVVLDNNLNGELSPWMV